MARARGHRGYRLLLRLLPRSFRDEMGRELETTFAHRLERAGSAGERARLWTVEVGGVLSTAVRVHAELFRQDLRWALRACRRSPGFTVTMVAVAALGIGATTASFSVTDHVLVRPLPFPRSDRLLKLWKDDARHGYPRMEPSPAEFRDWRERSRSFQSMASYWTTSATLVGVGEPERLHVAQVSAGLGDVLEIRPALGRLFTKEDDQPGAPATAVLSNSWWHSRFAGERSVLGRTISLDGEATTIIGVLPAGLEFPDRDVKLWKPHRFAANWYEDRDNNFLRVLGRLRDGVTVGAARAELAGIAAQLGKEYPRPDGPTGIRAIHLRDELSRESRRMLTVLLGAAVCLLLLACTNLASLLLVRSLSRSRELAVRAALGGGRARLVRQMLTESLLLAGAGGVLGVALAFAATPTLARLVPNSLPIAATPPVDLRVLAAAALVTLLTGLGFGLAPALRAPLDASAAELREGARAGTAGRKQRGRRVLVGVEVALSVTLVVGCGLLLRALTNLEHVDPGFESSGVLTLRTWLPRPEYDSTEKRQRFYSEVLDRAEALPGVSAAGYTSFLPMTMRGGIWEVDVAGRSHEKGTTSSASLRFVTPHFFEALGVPLRKGRETRESDTIDSAKVAVVSESFVKQFFPGRDPLGQHFKAAFFDRTIVGVVGNVAVRGLGKQSEPQVYLPNRQIPDGWMVLYDPKDLVVRATGPTGPLVAALRRIISHADPNLPITDVQSLDAVVAADTAPRATQVAVLGAFAALALLLAGLGLHGLLAYTVSSRQREIGVHVALGATRLRVAALVVRYALVPAAGGIAVGLLLAAAAGRALGSLLYGVGAFDPGTYAAAGAVMLVIAALGAALPTRRAVAVDPSAVLRGE